jgi:hypothetical protein
MTEPTKEEVLEIDAEQLQGLLGESDDKLPPMEIPFEWYDSKSFQKGIDDMSYLSGQITALLNCGVSEDFVLDFLLNKETIKHNIETANINKEMNIEMAKNQRLVAEKNEL